MTLSSLLMKAFLIRWAATTLAVAVAVKLTGMHAEGWLPLLFMALFLGVINAVIRPVVMLLSLPFILVTLGFFILIVNALLFWLAGGLVPGFQVDGFGNAFFGSLIVTVVNWLLSTVLKTGDGEFEMRGGNGHFRVRVERNLSEQSPREKVVAGRVVDEPEKLGH